MHVHAYNPTQRNYVMQEAQRWDSLSKVLKCHHVPGGESAVNACVCLCVCFVCALSCSDFVLVTVSPLSPVETV